MAFGPIPDQLFVEHAAGLFGKRAGSLVLRISRLPGDKCCYAKLICQCTMLHALRSNSQILHESSMAGYGSDHKGNR